MRAMEVMVKAKWGCQVYVKGAVVSRVRPQMFINVVIERSTNVWCQAVLRAFMPQLVVGHCVKFTEVLIQVLRAYMLQPSVDLWAEFMESLIKVRLKRSVQKKLIKLRGWPRMLIPVLCCNDKPTAVAVKRECPDR